VAPRATRDTSLTTYFSGDPMLLTLAIILFIVWALGFLAFHVTVAIIHILIVLAVIALVMHFVRGRKTVV
jgi:hypothetical protein